MSFSFLRGLENTPKMNNFFCIFVVKFSNKIYSFLQVFFEKKKRLKLLSYTKIILRSFSFFRGIQNTPKMNNFSHICCKNKIKNFLLKNYSCFLFVFAGVF